MNPLLPEPRPFQRSAQTALRQGFRDGHKNQVLMAPTGSGKTLAAMMLINDAMEKGKRCLFVADRITLIDQTSEVADSVGLNNHGIIQANHWRTNYGHPLQIASAQTLARRQWPDADLIVVDECHSQIGDTIQHLRATSAAVIGLSATPFAKGLGQTYSNLINAATMAELVGQGILVPMRVLTCTPANMEGAETSGGEWTERAAAERGMQIVGDVVSEWLEHAGNRKTIVFGATIAHCEELCRQFVSAGVMAAVFTADTKPAERQEILADYKKPDSKLRVLISVEALAKGFDVRDVSCVVDCRPLRKSLSTAIQMWGRCLRASPETGKTDALLLDHSGNISRFKRDFEDIYFNGLSALDNGEKLDKKVREEPSDDEKKGCPQCGHKPFFKRCMSCGFEIVKESGIVHQSGEMREIMIGKQKAADSARHLWQQACAYARAYSDPSKQQGRAFHIFKDIAGYEPPRGWRIETTPGVEISRAVANKIKANNIRYAKGRARAYA